MTQYIIELSSKEGVTRGFGFRVRTLRTRRQLPDFLRNVEPCLGTPQTNLRLRLRNYTRRSRFKTTVSLSSNTSVDSSWALTILCFLLILSLWTSYYVQIKRIRTVHETVLSIFAGMFVGMIVWASPGHLIRDMLVSPYRTHTFHSTVNRSRQKFKHTLFFNLLLPPIILNSGFELKQVGELCPNHKEPPDTIQIF